MKRSYIRALICLVVFAGSAEVLRAWGSFGHQHINHAAVFALPDPMRPFFYNHIDFITEESVIPDLRKYTLNDKSENPRHYIDIEGFEPVPFDSLPKTMKEAASKYDEKFLQKMGILPWYILDVMDKLTKSFREGRKTEILFLAGDLGHYIGDAHMPLHTSLNHDGQMTNQKGIHSFWEAQLPEYFGKGYIFRVGEARYLPDVQKATWDMIRQSHSLADTLLATERKVRARFTEDQVYLKDSSGQIRKNKFNQKIFSREYAQAYHQALDGMVENQMKLAIYNLACFWYTAWVNAGKPDLAILDPAELTKANRKKLEEELALFKKGKLVGFKSESEY